MAFKNILTQALHPNRMAVMAKKVGRRLADDRGLLSPRENLAWIEANCSNFAEMAVNFDGSLWKESEEVATQLEARAEAVLRSIEYELGGGGVYRFLYFITRYLQPACVVETGVAAGFSSYAFLAAIERNGKGCLYSSDFPYFRLPQPERLIGVLVEDSLKKNWRLFIEGDEANLPQILAEIAEIDIFHYDSDKSYRGRQFAMSLVAPRLAAGGIILMDDIQDNSFFHDYIIQQSVPHWRVFEFHGKYVGMIGELKPAQK
jgi:predicted O-methyltransferase YrrM